MQLSIIGTPPLAGCGPMTAGHAGRGTTDGVDAAGRPLERYHGPRFERSGRSAWSSPTELLADGRRGDCSRTARRRHQCPWSEHLALVAPMTSVPTGVGSNPHHRVRALRGRLESAHRVGMRSPRAARGAHHIAPCGHHSMREASRWPRGQPALTCANHEMQNPGSRWRRVTGIALRGPAVLRSIVRRAVCAVPSTAEGAARMDHLDQRGAQRRGGASVRRSRGASRPAIRASTPSYSATRPQAGG